MRLRYTLVAAGLAGLAVSWALATGAEVPGLVEEGRAGDGWLGELLRDDRWLRRIRKGLSAGLMMLGLCGAGLLALRLDRRRGSPLALKVIGTATPTALGAIRAFTCLIALVTVLWEDLSGVAILPATLANSMGVIAFLERVPAFAELVRSPAHLLAIEHATAGLLLLALCGLWTRLTLPLAAVAYLLFAGILRMYTHFFHTGLITLYVLAVLCMTPCGEGLSVDRWLRVRRGLPVPEAWTPTLRYGWARYACWAAIGITYLASGVAKLRNGGWLWWDAVNMRTKVVQESLQQTRFFDFQPGLFLKDGPDLLFALMGLGAIALEVGMISVLFSGLARRVLPAAIAAMHVGILVTQKILFPDCMAIQLIFYDHTKWLRRMGVLRLAADGSSSSGGARSAGKLPAAVVVMVSVYLAVVAHKVEFYPLTSWQMYSQRETVPTVTYYRAFALGDAGSREAFDLTLCSGALYDARYVDVLRRPFGNRAIEPIEDFLRSCAQRGVGAPGGERVIGYEIEKVVWHYREDATNPRNGQVAETYTYRVEGPSGGSLGEES